MALAKHYELDFPEIQEFSKKYFKHLDMNKV